MPAQLANFSATLTSNADETLDEMITRRREFLVDYQDAKLADKYSALVARVREVETSLKVDDALSRNVADAYFRLLSYKDEYEVARLHTRPEFLRTIRNEYGNAAKLRFHLAPPLLVRKRDARGRPLKKEFGAWMLPVFRILAGMRRLRGTPFDLFGYTAERRMERGLILEFEDLLDSALADMTVDRLGSAQRECQPIPRPARLWTGEGSAPSRKCAPELLEPERDPKCIDSTRNTAAIAKNFSSSGPTKPKPRGVRHLAQCQGTHDERTRGDDHIRETVTKLVREDGGLLRYIGQMSQAAT